MVRQRRASKVSRARPWIAIAALAWGAISCTDTIPGGEYAVSGRVSVQPSDDAGASPVGGATVTFTSDTGRVHETLTGDDGRYELHVFTDSAFGQVRAEAEGYAPSERTVYFDNPERRVDFVLRPPAPEM